ncbi:hypothetical protein VP01_4229g2 [Puccinia sorghi]|uniref:Uncharacterized protein n=1 Tax=Puccinia sorghi TaxID=27349 RepID=A0A0L6UQJ9_9BASI|nr:hypothetical protein VP01_4229g2 [Puccinia sorghi]
MKDNSKASTYIAQFWTLQSRIDWKNAAFAFHFQKGLLSCITDQLALTVQRLKTLQQLINQTIELKNCYHNKIWSSKKAESTPSTSKTKDSLKKKKFPSKPFTPSALTFAPRSRKSTEVASVLNKEGKLNLEERRSFKWDLMVLDAPGMDNTILGHDFLVYWNPDVDWQEGLSLALTMMKISKGLKPLEGPSFPSTMIMLKFFPQCELTSSHLNGLSSSLNKPRSSLKL